MTPKEFAAQWWAEKFMRDDMREMFKAELMARIPDTGDTLLDVDYDPSGILLDAVRAVGLKCAGVFFSANGILPNKTLMWVRPSENLCEWKCGYGGKWQERRFSAQGIGGAEGSAS